MQLLNIHRIKILLYYDIESFSNIDGLGLSSIVNGKMIIAGNKKLMEEYSINTEVIAAKIMIHSQRKVNQSYLLQ